MSDEGAFAIKEKSKKWDLCRVNLVSHIKVCMGDVWLDDLDITEKITHHCSVFRW